MSQIQSEKLLSSFPYGIQIKFWNCLKSWQNTINVDNTNSSENQMTKSNVVKDHMSISLNENEKPLFNLVSVFNDCSQGKSDKTVLYVECNRTI